MKNGITLRNWSISFQMVDNYRFLLITEFYIFASNWSNSFQMVDNYKSPLITEFDVFASKSPLKTDSSKYLIAFGIWCLITKFDIFASNLHYIE